MDMRTRYRYEFCVLWLLADVRISINLPRLSHRDRLYVTL